MSILNINIEQSTREIQDYSVPEQQHRSNTQLPSVSEISRVAEKFFNSREKNCLKTQLIDEKTAQWVSHDTRSIADVKKLMVKSDYADQLLDSAKKKARQLCDNIIFDYSKKNAINKASLVVFPEQDYLMTCQPKDEESLKWFWNNVISFNSSTIIAAILPGENQDTNDHSLKYCDPRKYPLQINEKWTVVLQGEEAWIKSELKEECQIVKRVFIVFSDQKRCSQITHYHYEGWKNKKGAPDVKCLSFLLRQLEIDRKKDSPITVHCAQGHGRSGNVVLADILQQRIVKQYRKGNVQLDDIEINILEILLQGRLLRDGFVEKPEQIVSAFDAALESSIL